MKALRIIPIVVLLAGAAALTGCSRDEIAHKGHGSGENTEIAGRGQGGRAQGENGRNSVSQESERGGYGNPRNERGNIGTEAYGESAGRQGLSNQERNPGNPKAGGPEQSGRVVVEKGGLADLTGTLEYDGSEWYLDTGDATYILHFGNSSYVDSTGLQLQADDFIEIHGFASGAEIAVVSAVIDSEVFEFRREDGTPLWAGRGRRSGGIAGQSETGRSGNEGLGRSGQGGNGRSRI